jgi:prepilin-type processing-associated H-X9-DG protein
MPIAFTCPHCGKQTHVDDHYGGQSGPCSGCGRTIMVPMPGPARPPAKSGGMGMGMVAIIAAAVILPLLCIIGVLAAVLFPAVGAAREAAQRTHCMNNLRQIGLALVMYEQEHGTFPPAYVADENGEPKHSWRVLILPYLEQMGTYNRYNFDEPWNSPENMRLASTDMSIFRCQSDDEANPGETNYVLVTGPGTVFPGSESMKMVSIRDGTSNTIMVVEVHGTGIHWMEPRDLDAAQMAYVVNGGPGEIGSKHRGGANVVFCDVHASFVSDATSPEDLRALTTANGAEVVSAPY